MKQDVIIYTGKMARKLLREGFELIDIKPDNTDPDRKRSVFIFRSSDKLKQLLTKR